MRAEVFLLICLPFMCPARRVQRIIAPLQAGEQEILMHDQSPLRNIDQRLSEPDDHAGPKNIMVSKAVRQGKRFDWKASCTVANVFRHICHKICKRPKEQRVNFRENLAKVLVAFNPRAVSNPALGSLQRAVAIHTDVPGFTLTTAHLAHCSRPRQRVPRTVACAGSTVKCDYLVVGAGASGMAFVDTLLLHKPTPVSIVLLDKRTQPGGHWNDAYSFVTLHQPARNYGVESSSLEANVQHPELLASRAEVLNYYQSVLDGWQSKGHEVTFIGGVAYDFESASYTKSDGTCAVVHAGKVVDARYTENDLPVHVPPKFAFSAEHIDVIPPNKLPERGQEMSQRCFCVLGAGKTGQDTMLYLRQVLGVPASSIVWVMPNDPWITARDPPRPLSQITCMEFIATALEAHSEAGAPLGAAKTSDFLQRGFAQLEREGKVYRIDQSVTPNKFMDATLNRHEVEVLRSCVSCIVRGRGRVASIAPNGDLVFSDGSIVPLPWGGEGDTDGASSTTFVHCTAGAFNFGSSAAEARRAVFSSERLITVQEVFQFPGFCFNGAVIAWLECQHDLSQAEKNSLCELPPIGMPAVVSPLGPVAGNLGPCGREHPLIVSLLNLRRWYDTPGMGKWLHSLRLFSLKMNNYTLEEGKVLVKRNHAMLVAAGIIDKK